MSRTTLGFIYSALFYLLLGVVLGVLFILIPDTRQLRTVHAHLNLMGFVSFMIFGISYHILPRFRGRPLHSEALAWFQFWLANFSLAGLLVFTALDIYLGWGFPFQGIFASLLALSILFFIYNVGRTLIEPYKEE